MTEYQNIILISLVFTPLIGSLLNSFHVFLNKDSFEKLISPIISILILLVEFTLTVLVFNEYKSQSIERLELTINYLGIDELSGMLSLIVNGLFLLIGIYSLYYIKSEKFAKYFTLFFILQLGIILSLMSTNLFVLFLAWELMVISGYVLVVFTQTKLAYEAGIKYLIISSFGSLLVLFGIGLLTGLTSTLNFMSLSLSTDIANSLLGKFALGMLIMGFGVTAGFIFLNQWLPDAHPEAPAPVSAILSGIVVKIGIYVLYRLFSILYPVLSFEDNSARLILVLAIMTMTEGNVMVFAQFQRSDGIDFKRILAYSTTVHLGFLMLLVPVQSEVSGFVLFFHILNHGLAKVLLFTISGFLIVKLKTRNVNEMIGFGSYDKFIGITLFIGLMSLAGLPGTGGFVSKFLVILTFYSNFEIGGSSQAFMVSALVFIIINTILAFIGYMWLIKKFIFEKPPIDYEIQNIPKDKIAKGVFATIAVIILILGLYPRLYLDYIM